MTQLRRILHVFGGMDRGGAESMVMNLYRHLDRSRFQFDFVVHTDRACHYDAEIESLGGRILRLPTPAVAGLRAYAAAFRRALAHSGPFAAVHSHVHHFSGVVLYLSLRYGVPVRVSHSHSAGETRRLPLYRLAYARSMRLLIHASATHLLGCSRQACERLFGRRCWSDRRVRVAANAIALSRYCRAAHGSAFRDELRLDWAAPLIGHIGSFTEPKNHSFTLRLFRELADRFPSMRFVLVGDGPLRPQIEAQVEDLGLTGKVHLVGVRSDIPRVLGALDLLLLPSLWEGLPLVLIEAQAAGVACLVSDAVTPECDLVTGLVRFASLQAGPAAWVADCLAQLRLLIPPAEVREHALRRAGYDAAEAAGRLTGIYTDRKAA